MKRAFDVVLSAFGIALVSPILLIAAIAVRRSSPGPIFFRQDRVGLRGELFKVYKFRSMTVNDAAGPAAYAGEARVTAAGRIIRRTKIDELPQLFNVFRGEMSLVGPRPQIPHYVAMYTAEQRQVLTVKPGVTGPSQIAFRDEEAILARAADPEQLYISQVMPAKLALDLGYVRHHTLFGDLGLILRTFTAILLPMVPGFRRKAQTD
ncbi:MAG: sugar transferase [Armatimonadetes bacterium]|nr:sugar transferase [Armatimonadota bacterium]MDE2207783.1 sugar transferase [Armatimonadota bacterium]